MYIYIYICVCVCVCIYIYIDRVNPSPVLLSSSQDVSLIQRVLNTLVLRLIMNDGFSFDSSIACYEFFWISWVNRS